MIKDIHKFSARELQSLYAKQEISPVEVFNSLYEYIETVNPALNCFSVLDYDRALLDAQASEQRWERGEPRGPLDGVPTTIKDGFNAIGWPTLFGSKTVNPHQDWNEDAPITTSLREAGTVILGKTTMPEYGWKGVTESPVTGVTKNPWNLNKTSGGSSGGAASGVASGLFPLAVGTDGGGSIRIPASFCGVFGLKPSRYLVPMAPASPLGTFVHAGPITRTVDDAAALMNVIAQYHPKDCYNLPVARGDYTLGLEQGIEGLNIAFSPSLGYYSVDDEVATSVEQAVEQFKQLGARVTLANPAIPDYLNCFNLHWLVSMRHHYLQLNAEQQQLLDPHYADLAQAAESIDLYQYFNAQQQRRMITVAMNEFFMEYDLLITPTEPCVAFDLGKDSPHPEKGAIDSWTPFTCLFNLTGHPAATIPCGFSSDGLPIGLQVVGRHLDDHLVLRACRAYERLKPIELAPIK